MSKPITPICQGIFGNACGRVGTQGMAIDVLPVDIKGSKVGQILVVFCRECGRIHGVLSDGGKTIKKGIATEKALREMDKDLVRVGKAFDKRHKT